MTPGSFVLHPPGELHEYANGPQRTLLFHMRYGADMQTRQLDWRGNPAFKQSAQDAENYRQNPVNGTRVG